MIIIYKNKKYKSELDVKNMEVYIINGNDEVNKIIKKTRIQRGLLMGTLLNNPIYNLDVSLKNNKL